MTAQTDTPEAETAPTITRQMRARYRAALDSDVRALLDAWLEMEHAETEEAYDWAEQRAEDIKLSLPWPDRVARDLAQYRGPDRITASGKRREAPAATLTSVRRRLLTEPLDALQSHDRDVRIATMKRLTGRALYGQQPVAAAKPRRAR